MTETLLDDTMHAKESERLRSLHRLNILDTPPEQAFDDLVGLAARMIGVPMAALTIIDTDRQWFKASVGLGITETPRNVAFCDHVVRHAHPVVVEDAQADPRFAENPNVVSEPYLRFYAGVPVFSGQQPIGSLCVMASESRLITDDHLEILRSLARQVEQLLELRWRRNIEAPPQQMAVEILATAIRGPRSFALAMEQQFRPAWVYDRESLAFLAVNDAAVEQYGWPREQWLQMTILDIRPPEDAAVLEAAIRNSDFIPYAGGRVWQHRRADGSCFDVQITGTPITFDGRSARFAIASDVTGRSHSEQTLLRASLHDSLTGLPNRRYFLQTLNRLLSTPHDALSLVIVGLDRFKLVNDTAGHDIGDALLGAVAARLANCAASPDLVARLGGDEFAVVLSDRSDQAIGPVARSIIKAVTAPIYIGGGEFYLTASAGVAMVTASSTAQSLLAEADVAMYAAKRTGGRSVLAFDDDMRHEIAEWSAVQRDLHRAIEREEFELDYQPIIDLKTGAVSFEALIRWNHPTRGRLLPDTFITVAEESGLIGQIGRWVMREGARAAAELDADVSINVSVHQFNDALISDFDAAMAETHLRPGQLIIEVTESALVDTHLAQSIVNRLRSRGARIWIDDFGTGYSSLSRLSQLTVDALKLDRSFIMNTDTAQGIAIATSVINLGRGLGVQVVAEGIETSEQFALLGALGCHQAQGYFLGRPMPLAMAELLTRAGEFVDR